MTASNVDNEELAKRIEERKAFLNPIVPFLYGAIRTQGKKTKHEIHDSHADLEFELNHFEETHGFKFATSSGEMGNRTLSIFHDRVHVCEIYWQGTFEYDEYRVTQFIVDFWMSKLELFIGNFGQIVEENTKQLALANQREEDERRLAWEEQQRTDKLLKEAERLKVEVL